MCASTGAGEDDHTCFSARPRPLRSTWTVSTSGTAAASRVATCQVPSVLALSASVIRKG